MCLAVPAKVVSIDGAVANVDMMGNSSTADISLLENVRVGDYIMVHVGFAIQKYDETEALLTLSLIEEMLGKANHVS
ncbi:MAG: HypC/HybG/HupF family hydrogenase formation chaperone [Chitinivibrionales bacterium]